MKWFYLWLICAALTIALCIYVDKSMTRREALWMLANALMAWPFLLFFVGWITCVMPRIEPCWWDQPLRKQRPE